MPTAADDRLICLGVIVGAIGVRGEVRVKTFTETPDALGDYGPLSDQTGTRTFKVQQVRSTSKGMALRLEGVTDRDVAQALKGTELCVPRSALGEADEEESYYHVDLIGLVAEDEDGDVIGKVQAVHDFGAGDVLEVRLEDGKSEFVAFLKETVPDVDIEAGRLVIRLPDMTEATQGEGEDA